MDVEEFIAHLHKTGLAAKTIREHVTIVSLIMQCAVKARVRRDNPAAGHKLGVRYRRIGTGDVLDMDEALRLVEHVTVGRWCNAVWLLLLTGMRPSELCGLRAASIDFTRRTCRVSASLQPVQRFGNDEHCWKLVEGPPKTDAGDRTIPLPAWLCDALAAMLAERRGNSGRLPARDEYLFVTKYGNPINLNKMRERVIRPALKAAGLPETLRTYDLRHSHASLLIDLGGNPLAVAQRLGHSDPAMTLRIYGHLFEGVQEHLTDQLDVMRITALRAANDDDVVPLAGHK